MAGTLPKQLNHEEVDEYLKNRAGEGFTGDQAYVLRGLGVPNVYGDLPPAARNLAADRTLHQHRSARFLPPSSGDQND